MPCTCEKESFLESYEAEKGLVRQLHPDLPDHDMRIMLAMRLRPLFASDRISAQSENENLEEYNGPDFSIDPQGNVYYPDYGDRQLLALHERDSEYGSKYSRTDHLTSLHIQEAFRNGATEVVTSYARPGGDNRDVIVMRYDPETNRGTTTILNTAPEGRYHTFENIEHIASKRFDTLSKVKPNEHVFLLTDVPYTATIEPSFLPQESLPQKTDHDASTRHHQLVVRESRDVSGQASVSGESAEMPYRYHADAAARSVAREPQNPNTHDQPSRIQPEPGKHVREQQSNGKTEQGTVPTIPRFLVPGFLYLLYAEKSGIPEQETAGIIPPIHSSERHVQRNARDKQREKRRIVPDESLGKENGTTPERKTVEVLALPLINLIARSDTVHIVVDARRKGRMARLISLLGEMYTTVQDNVDNEEVMMPGGPLLDAGKHADHGITVFAFQGKQSEGKLPVQSGNIRGRREKHAAGSVVLTRENADDHDRPDIRLITWIFAFSGMLTAQNTTDKDSIEKGAAVRPDDVTGTPDVPESGSEREALAGIMFFVLMYMLKRDQISIGDRSSSSIQPVKSEKMLPIISDVVGAERNDSIRMRESSVDADIPEVRFIMQLCWRAVLAYLFAVPSIGVSSDRTPAVDDGKDNEGSRETSDQKYVFVPWLLLSIILYLSARLEQAAPGFLPPAAASNKRRRKRAKRKKHLQNGIIFLASTMIQ